MITRNPEVVGFATHHDEPMLFPSKVEAAAYCEAAEEPIALIRLEEYEALQAECEKLRKDAERYQWLKHHAIKGSYDSDWEFPLVDAWEYRPGPDANVEHETLDAAIDAAMQEGGA